MTFNKLQVCALLLIISTITIICADDLSSSISTFVKNIYNKITKNDNLVFSPFSAYYALTLAYAGAAGDTAASFESALGLPKANETAFEYKPILANLNSAENITIKIANKIYLQNGFKLKENFKSTAKTSFDADVDTINFENSTTAAQEINAWVKEKTNNKIDKLFDADSFDGLTRTVLINAIYFKGAWLSPYPENLTKSGKFYVSETESIPHPMMFQEGYFDFAISEELDAQILILKYSNPRFAMTVVLPNSKTGINDLEKKVSNIDLNSFDTVTTKVAVTLPKFKIESDFDLKEPLTQLGLEGIFTDGANFSNMIDEEKDLVITKVIQKAFIEVNEEGSEASAAGGIELGTRSKPPRFTADHPFIFFITATLEDKSPTAKTVLFSGKVVSPTY